MRFDRKIMSPGAIPTVSVIVPNFNHARFLRERIESVLAQTYQDFEVILLDDCSTDESRSIIGGYVKDPRVRVEFNEKNSGSTFRQWNRGVRLARGKYVWIAESDDYADEHLLEKLACRLDAEPDAVLCYCRSWRVSSDGKISGFLDPEVTDSDPNRWAMDFVADGREECWKYLSKCNSIPNASAVLFRRAAYERVGGADENLHLCGDWKLWTAMALTGEITYIANPLNYFRFHDSSVRVRSRRLGMEATESLEVIRSIVERMMPPDGDRRKLPKNAFPPALLDGYRYCMQTLERSDPEAVLRAVEDFLRLSDYGGVNRWEVAEAWLRAARIQYRQGRLGRALLSAVRGFLIRPIVAGRPLKRVFSRIATALKS
jgi:glycosyltransferase involved in cell wall biosynthesis